MILKPAQYGKGSTCCGLHGYSLVSVLFITGPSNIAVYFIKINK